MGISAVVLTKNEEHRIRRCLDSLKSWVDEIVVVDDESTDNTVAIAKEYGARVIVHPLNKAFDAQRNRSLAAATQEWVIQIDADEVVPPSTAEAIKAAINNQNEYIAFELLWRDCIWDMPLNHVGGSYKLRLFKRSAASYKGNIHERLIMTGNTGRIASPVWNYAVPSVSSMLAKHNVYTDMEVEGFLAAHPQLTVAQLKKDIIFKTVKTFYKHYFKNGGRKDGTAGFVWCVIHTIYPLVLRLKALERLENK